MFTIRDLFKGGFAPVEIPPASEEFLLVSKELSEKADKFLLSLSPEQKTEFEKLQELESQRSLEELTAAFKMGFRLSTQLMLDALSEDGNT